MSIAFYNDSLKKITYGNHGNIDFSMINIKLTPDKEYVCKMANNDPNMVVECFELKHMQFEIRKIKESSSHDNIYSCGVKVLSYENGTEYPRTENVVVVGYFYNAYPEAIYNTIGYWGIGKDGRDIFYITERDQVINSSENSITKYLTSIFKGKSIGKQTINKIVSAFGVDALDKIRENDPELKKLIRTKQKRELIIEELKKSIEQEKALNYLVQNNIPAEIAINVINKLGATTYTQIINDPYILLKFNNLSIERVNAIAQKNGISYYSESNIDGLVLRYIKYRTNTFGDIYVDRADFFTKNNGYTKFELFYDKYDRYKKFNNDAIKSSLRRLLFENKIVITDDLNDPDNQCIYESSYHMVEKFIIDKLTLIRNAHSSTILDVSIINKDLSDIEKTGVKLDKLQKDAVINALTNKLSIISGGPGSGKTFVTKIIVDIFKKHFPTLSIQLCAPTGKASRRMSEVIGLPASTIHRKLGYGSGELIPIKDNLLIIDECSMMDIDLFYKTLSAVEDDTSIILVGDYNQLPSVGPGLILRDLIDSEAITATLLKSVFRQSNGSEIINAANAVLDKKVDNINQSFGKDFVFIEQASKQEIYENIEGCIRYLIDNGVSSERIQILTPQNEGLIGTTGLNNLMRDICNPPDKHSIGMLIKNTMFYVGDRIIETENNADLNIFNGSIGTIVDINKEGVIADFDGHRVKLTQGDMSTIKLGYAITVHRSQGSEFDFVFMPIIQEHEFTLNKNLLYTGITRAKKMFVLLGQKDVLTNTVQKEIVCDRKSQIKGRLKEIIQTQ